MFIEFINKIFINICSFFKNIYCKSSCCNGKTTIEFENKKLQKDNEMEVMCCFGCCNYKNSSNIHSNHKNND